MFDKIQAYFSYGEQVGHQGEKTIAQGLNDLEQSLNDTNKQIKENIESLGEYISQTQKSLSLLDKDIKENIVDSTNAIIDYSKSSNNLLLVNVSKAGGKVSVFAYSLAIGYVFILLGISSILAAYLIPESALQGLSLTSEGMSPLTLLIIKIGIFVAASSVLYLLITKSVASKNFSNGKTLSWYAVLILIVLSILVVGIALGNTNLITGTLLFLSIHSFILLSLGIDILGFHYTHLKPYRLKAKHMRKKYKELDKELHDFRVERHKMITNMSTMVNNYNQAKEQFILGYNAGSSKSSTETAQAKANREANEKKEKALAKLKS